MHISYSRFSLYLRCPYAHYLRYIEGLKSIKPVRPLYFGSDFHKLLEVRADKTQVKKEWKRMKEDFYRMPASWQEELGENYPDDLKTIFQDYQAMWKGTPIPQITEHPFELTLSDVKGEPVIFVGVIDELYKHKDGIDVGEHKTFNRPPDMNFLVMNTQKSLYCKACELIWGELPKHVKWDYIKSTPAKSPIWLEKSGRFSTAANKDITPRSWRRACKEKGITDPTILEQGENYRGNENNFFFRVEQDVYPQMVEDVFEGFEYTCRDIVRRSHKNKVKNITRDCAWCEFRDVCMAELSGGDREYAVSQKFKNKFEEEKDGNTE